MSRAAKDAVLAVAYMLLGGLIAIAVLAPEVALARRQVARANVDKHLIETRCTVFVDGSATCRPDTFEAKGVQR